MTFGRMKLGLGWGSGKHGGSPIVPGIITAGAGSYTWSGDTMTPVVDYKIPAGAGSYAWTGTDASFLRSRLIAASGGSYTYTGQDATLTKAAGGGSLSFAASATTPAWQDSSNSPYDFSVNIGTAAADRMVAVCVYVEGTAAQGTVTAVTIDPAGGAFAMTLGPNITSATSSAFGIYIYYLLETTLSGVQTIRVVTSGIFPPTVDVQVGIITGSATVAFGSGGTRAYSAASADPQAVTAASAVPANGVAVTAVMLDRTTTPSWTGATNDKNVQSAGRSVVALMAHGTVNNPSFTGANNFGSIMAIATFGP